jgi:hypothetical protein
MGLIKNERGFSLLFTSVVVFFSLAISGIIAKDLLSFKRIDNEVTASATGEIANTFDLEERKNVAIGDNIYEVTPVRELKEDIYSVTDMIKLTEDLDILTATMDTKYGYMNYILLNGDTILDYRIDPKTSFVGFTLDDSIETGDYYTVTTTSYPSRQSLIPTNGTMRNRLTFMKNGNRYKLIYPASFNTSNGAGIGLDTTTVALRLPSDWTDIYFFQTDLTHQAPIVLNNKGHEVTWQLETMPYIHLNLDDDIITLNTNLVSIEDGAINNTIAQQGIEIGVTVYDAESYNITSQGSKLNYPTQNSFKYQIYNQVPMSNWNYFENAFSVKFTKCIPKTITINRKAYYHELNKSNDVIQKDYF